MKLHGLPTIPSSTFRGDRDYTCHLLETFGTLLNSVVPNIYLLPNASLNLLFLIYTLHTSLKSLSLALIFIPNEKLYVQKF